MRALLDWVFPNTCTTNESIVIIPAEALSQGINYLSINIEGRKEIMPVVKFKKKGWRKTIL
ncbi:MAG: hypothetical protein ACLFQU_11160 [Candidatus Kapaibacterium sp.]